MSHSEVIEIPPLASSQAAWWAVKGNNHRFIRVECRRGGIVSFSGHIGKRLTARLWEDLTERFGLTNLRVYSADQPEWCDSVTKSARIRVDEQGIVTDISIET